MCRALTWVECGDCSFFLSLIFSVFRNQSLGVTLHLHTPQPHMMIKIGSALFLFLLLLLGTTAQPASLGDLLQPEAGLFEFTQPTHAEDVLTAFVFPDSPEKSDYLPFSRFFGDSLPSVNALMCLPCHHTTRNACW